MTGDRSQAEAALAAALDAASSASLNPGRPYPRLAPGAEEDAAADILDYLLAHPVEARAVAAALVPDSLDVERLRRALRRMVGGGADAIEGAFDVGWLTYSGEATFDELAAAIAAEYAALREGRTP